VPPPRKRTPPEQALPFHRPAGHVTSMVAQARLAPGASLRDRPAAPHVHNAVAQAKIASPAPPIARRPAAPPSPQLQTPPILPRLRPVVQRMLKSPSSASSSSSTVMKEYTIQNGSSIYHGTTMKVRDIPGLVNGTTTLKVPAYFKTYFSDYGARTLRFEATKDIKLLDMSDTGTVRCLYTRIVESGDVEAAEALLYKAKSKNEEDLAAPPSWRTVGYMDDALASWFTVQRFKGWRMPFASGDELMLTSMDGLSCKGKA
jgi:hypothetical protein